MKFLELHIDVQRNPKVVSHRVIVGTSYIVRVEPRDTIDKDGGALVHLTDGKPLQVVESYKYMKQHLKA